ncbi:hypothetical protein E2562_034836 [Oryza meyeriana var. granulata]|uniref:Uncharacterized protein n=1 Tax=Oryza meyeriana var. granulata TaxID=110450 RepID=A0A6G1E736_9ORYZ|nr:hypothetical protein E2562_034836 [Oryza meyeriana var. granulata]
MAHDNTSEQLRKLAEQNNFGGSDPRAASHQLNHHISSFYPVTPLPRTNHSSLAPLQPARNQQPPLPSYLSSEITNGHSSNAGRSASVLGKRPAESFFQPPAPPVDAGDDMAAVEHGPQCNLQTVDLLSLVESVGTPEFLANSERVLGSAGGSLTMERKRGTETTAATQANLASPVKTLGLDGQGCSRDAAMQRRPWN